MKKRIILLAVLVVLIACLAPLQADATSSIRILYKCNNINPNSNTISPFLEVCNDGPDTLTLSQVKIRYWYTRDTGRPQSSACDYAGVGASNITRNCVAMSNPTSTADYYFEVGFTSGAGTVASGSNSGEIQLRIYNDDWSNYNQANDYSFNSSYTNYGANTCITAYINGNLVYGTEPTPTSTNKFLVIVSKPLYNTGSITSALNTYLSDLTAASWTPLMKTVDTVSSTSPDYVCASPSALKSVIQSYYSQGYIGFVLIGSDPAIPTVFWRCSLDPGEEICPTDLFYADMDPWTDVNSDGVYDSHGPSGEHYNANFAPEMIYGRISAAGISTSLSDEASRVASYLNKVHTYRTSGSNLTQAQQKRTLLFYDHPDFKGCRGVIEGFLGLTTEIHGVFDDQTTTPEKLKTELENGYQFAQFAIHSGADAHGMSILGGGTNFDLAYANATTIRVHYLNLYCCDALCYHNWHDGSPIDLASLGFTYLFNNSYTLNVTGSSGGWGMMPDATYWSDIRQGKAIGKAFHDYLGRIASDDGIPKAILAGDPTIVYNVPTVTNKMAWINTSLEGAHNDPQAHAYPGQEFVIGATDAENDPATITVTGLPTGATTSSQANRFSWTPASSDLGKIYHLTATASDGTGHSYVEEFTVKVVSYPTPYVENPSFDGVHDIGGGVYMPNDWTAVTVSGSPSFVSDYTEKHNSEWAVKITNTSSAAGCFRMSGTASVVPNTDYLLTGWIKTTSVSGGTGAQIGVTGISTAFTSSVTGSTNGWVQVGIKFNSGSNSLIQLESRLGSSGNASTGTAWFDELKLQVWGTYTFVAPGFESPTTMWDFWNKASSGYGTTFTADSSIKRSGSYSLKIDSASANDVRVIQLVDNLLPNTAYTLTGYIRANVSSGRGAALNVDCDGSSYTSDGLMNTSNSWTQVTVNFTTGPTGCAFISAALGWWDNHSIGTAYFDDFSIL